MSKIIFTALFLSGSIALANCPELAGNYNCKTDNSAFELSLTQTVDANGHTVYSDGTLDLIADGNEHTFTLEDITETYTATCIDASMIYKYNDLYKDGYAEQGEAKFSINGNVMTIEQDGEKATCTK